MSCGALIVEFDSGNQFKQKYGMVQRQGPRSHPGSEALAAKWKLFGKMLLAVLVKVAITRCKLCRGVRGVMQLSQSLKDFESWYKEACESQLPSSNGMMLATASKEGRPSVRMVLLKAFDADGFVFYTNLSSHKAQDLLENPQASLCFWWQPWGREVRVSGSIVPVTDAEADAYFATRPKLSQIGAWASKQSHVMGHQAEFVGRIALFSARYALSKVPRPSHWSGFRLVPARIEFGNEDGIGLVDNRV